MAILLTREKVDELLEMSELIDALEKAQIQYSTGKVVQPLRSNVELSRHPGELLMMPGYLEEEDALGVKVLALRLDNPKVGLPIVHATVLLLDADSGRLLALLDGGSITAARTAAVSGVATRYLARGDASRLAIIGTGRQARTHLWAMLCVRPIQMIRVYSRTPQGAFRFRDEMGARFQLPIEVVESAEEAVGWADVLVLSTSARTPVLSASWLPEGLHINSIASMAADTREMDTETVRRGKLIVDSREAALQESGDLLIPMSEGAIGRDHIYAEVGEIASGAKAGRTSDHEITIYKSLGMAIQDVAAARLLYEKAVDRGIGLEVDL